MMNNNKRSWILISLFILVFLTYSFFYFGFTVDDAWITFRYGKNLVEHGVWNYHPSTEPKVEAYTNAIYAFVSVIPHFLHIPPQVFFKILGLGFLSFLIFEIFRNLKSNLAFYPTAALILFPYFYIHLYSGLETILFITLIFYICLQTPKLFDAHLGVIFLALVFPLVRPEGVLFPLMLGALWIYQKNWKGFQKLILSGIVYTLYYLIRWYFFGSFFPSPFYVKTVNHYHPHILQSIWDSMGFWLPALVLILVSNSKRLLPWLGLSLAVWIFLYSPSSLQMNFASRFVFQILFPVYLASIVLALSGMESGQLSNNKKFLIHATLIFSLLFWCGKTWIQKSELITLIKYSSSSDISHKQLALKLNSTGPLKIMMGDAGIFAYNSNSFILDVVGLANIEIAKNGVTLDMLKREVPDLFFLYNDTRNPEILWDSFWQFSIKDYFTATNNYEYVSSIRCLDGFFLLTFVKKDHPKYKEIKRILKEHQELNDAYEFKVSDMLTRKYL